MMNNQYWDKYIRPYINYLAIEIYSDSEKDVNSKVHKLACKTMCKALIDMWESK